MQKIFMILLATIWAAVLSADIVMRMDSPRSCYMLYEPVVINLALRNTSGQALIFGNEAEFKGHLEVELTDMQDRPLKGSGTRVELNFMTGYQGYHYDRAPFKINFTKGTVKNIQLEKTRPLQKASVYGKGTFIDCTSPAAAGEILVRK